MESLLRENLPAMVQWIQEISPWLWQTARNKVLVAAMFEIIIPIIVLISECIVFKKFRDKLRDKLYKDDFWTLCVLLIMVAIFFITMMFFGIYKLFTIDYHTILSLKELLLP